MKTAAVAAALLAVALTAPVRAADLLKVGDPFPAWSLTDQAGATVSSADLAGKTYLLWFYPKAMTPGCTAEGRGLRDQITTFHARGIEILGVSFDDPDANARFAQAESFPFRLLSDQKRQLAVRVGAADSASAPVARRISYLVGGDGKVLQVYDTVNPASHAKDVLGGLGESSQGPGIHARHAASTAPSRASPPETDVEPRSPGQPASRRS